MDYLYQQPNIIQLWNMVRQSKGTVPITIDDISLDKLAEFCADKLGVSHVDGDVTR